MDEEKMHECEGVDCDHSKHEEAETKEDEGEGEE